jgi:hypothetical protein
MTESLAFDHEAKPQPLRRGYYKLYFHYTDTVSRNKPVSLHNLSQMEVLEVIFRLH